MHPLCFTTFSPDKQSGQSKEIAPVWRAEVDKALEDIRAENKKMRMDLDQQVAWCRTEHSDILDRTNEVEGWVLGRQVCFLTIIFT